MTTSKSPQPPRLAELVIEALTPDPDVRAATLGDMAEEFAQVAAERSVFRAHDWYWTETVRSAPSLLWISLRGGVEPWARLVAAAFVGVLAMGTVLSMGTTAALYVFRPWQHPWMASVLEMLTGIMGAVAVGYLIGVIGGPVKLLVSFGLGTLIIGMFARIILVNDIGFEMTPAWFEWTRIGVILPALMAGALVQTALRRRHQRLVAS